MIYPSIDELTNNGEINRYELVIATAKCARKITEGYIAQREVAERAIANKDTDKSIAALVSKEFRDDKAVRTAINRIQSGAYEIIPEGGVSKKALAAETDSAETDPAEAEDAEAVEAEAEDVEAVETEAAESAESAADAEAESAEADE